MDTLQWKKDINIDNSYEKIDFHEYSSHTGVDLNNHHGDIRIVIQNQDQFLLPSKSYLYIEAQLLAEDDVPYESNETVALTNNGLMYLFERVSYKIGQQQVESYSNPGLTSTVKGLLTYPSSYYEGSQFLWKKDTNPNASVNNNKGFKLRYEYTKKKDGKFTGIIPLNHIFGFTENYNRLMYGIEHTLILRRNHDNDAIFRVSKYKDAEGKEYEVESGKVNITKLSWHMPHVKLGEEYQLKLYEDIGKEVQIPIRFLSRQCEKYTIPENQSDLDWRLNITTGSERPRYIFLVFQDDKQNNQTKNAAIFDHMNVRDAHIQLNSERYPEMSLDCDFDNNRYIKPYKMLTDYFQHTLGKESLGFGIIEFKTLYPILVFDVSRQSERLKNTPVDIRIKVSFDKPIKNSHVEAFAVILSDRFMKLKSDGSKMNVIY